MRNRLAIDDAGVAIAGRGDQPIAAARGRGQLPTRECRTRGTEILHGRGVVTALNESRETVPVLTCIIASGIQRIVNAAEGLLDVSVCVSPGVTLAAALAMVLNALSNEAVPTP